MRYWILMTIILGGLAVLLAMQEVSLSNQIKSFQRDKEESALQQQSLSERLDSAEGKLAQQQDQFPPDAGNISTINLTGSSPTRARIVALENQLRSLQTTLHRQPAGPVVPEYDPTNPQPEPEPETNAPPKRSWGTEQALGPPDTVNAGDAPTAWASLEANGGPEWLALGFDHAVDLAQVRIRETYNPGAISKVTAIMNDAEVVLWEGTAAPGKAPRDFVLPVSSGIQANSVIVHLDTKRVSSWSEIDAVELVGRDGSRQWATSANASSTYAEKTRTASTVEFEPLPH